MKKAKAKRVYYEKSTSPSGLTIEKVVWRVGDLDRYPEGFKYRLVLVDHKQSIVHLLYDNHHPKGGHIHKGSVESRYYFISVDQLILDFESEWQEIDGRISDNESKKN